MLEVAAAAAPGTRERAGWLHPVGRRLQHLDRVGTQEPVALVALGDLDDHPLAGQRVPDEHDDAVVARDDEPAVRDPVGTHVVPLTDQ